MDRVNRRAPARRVVLDDAGAPARVSARPDVLAVEEPLEIRVDGRSVTTTMRTPGDDFDLALGWLVGEGVIAAPENVHTLQHCLDESADGRPTYNVVDVTSGPGLDRSRLSGRSVAATSACGVCGTASIAALAGLGDGDLRLDHTRVHTDVLARLPEALRSAQHGFARTGGTHAAGLFDVEGRLLCLREDVGRHNAVDKVVGWAVREGRLPLTGTVLLVSGRAGFEIVQKALAAGVPVLASVSASTSLAVDLARARGLTLAAFLRPPRLTIYAGGHRLIAGGQPLADDPDAGA